VDSKTGKVLWQLGGKRNQFKPLGGDFLWFAGQHSPILLKNGNIAIYDNQGVNGNKKSRMVIYKLDEANRTVTQVYEYPINSFSTIMGNVQELDNDSFLISTGFTVDSDFNKDPNAPQFFEINKDKEITFSMQFDGTDVSTYRCFEFKDVSVPDLHLEIKNKLGQVN
jgi:hypothetical protein